MTLRIPFVGNPLIFAAGKGSPFELRELRDGARTIEQQNPGGGGLRQEAEINFGAIKP